MNLPRFTEYQDKSYNLNHWRLEVIWKQKEAVEYSLTSGKSVKEVAKDMGLAAPHPLAHFTKK